MRATARVSHLARSLDAVSLARKKQNVNLLPPSLPLTQAQICESCVHPRMPDLAGLYVNSAELKEGRSVTYETCRLGLYRLGLGVEREPYTLQC